MATLPPDTFRVVKELNQRGIAPSVLGVYVIEELGLWETFALFSESAPEVPLHVDGWKITPVSTQSPIGQCLLNSQVAERVRVSTPDGEYHGEIVSVNGCPIASPQERLRLRREREEERRIYLAERWKIEQEAQQQRLQHQKDKATIEDLKNRRKNQERLWRQEISSR